MHENPHWHGPLKGVRVLDVSRLVAGNISTHVLADFGAEVIKIEHPKAGDDLRAWRVEGVSTSWEVYARNKKSVALDIKTPPDKDIFLKLIESAEVLVENFTPGTLEKWGLGPDVLHGQNPKLIILRISGWGQTGPYAKKPGFGTLVEAMSGFAAMNGFGDRPPVLPPFALADAVAGLYGACAILMVLRNIELSQGLGQIIDLSLFEALFSVLGPTAADYHLSGRVKGRTGSRTEITAPRNVYACGDGKFVALSGSTQAMAERLFRAIGREDLVSDPRYLTNTERVKNCDSLDAVIQGFLSERTQDEALEFFDREGITVGPVLDVAELLQHPYIEGREVITHFGGKEAGALPMHAVVPRLSGTPGSIRTAAPTLGQHNAELVGGLEENVFTRAGAVP